MSLVKEIKKLLPPSIRARVVPAIGKIVFRNNLNRLAGVFGTDKWGRHWYTQHYQRYFEPLRKMPLNFLEIGVGGYANASDGGQSLRMWSAFFPHARIVGLDIEDKTHFARKRIDIRVGDQTDAVLLRSLSNEYGGFDIIIDDGSHLNEHVVKTFHILFPLLKSPGIYAIEDTQTAYWPGWGGGIDNPNSSMAFFKRLTDGLNYVEFPVEGYTPSYFEQNIREIAFFHNLIVIRKGPYAEQTNAPEFVQAEIEAARTVDPVEA